MLLVLLKLREKVEKYCQDYKSEVEEDILSFIDQKKLCMIKDFLAPFLQATLFTKRDSVSINRTLFTMDILIKHIQETTVSLLPSLLLPS